MGSQAVHHTVPGVIYTDPELASIGLSYIQCVQRYGTNGFDCLNVAEEGTDRGDMERLERPVIGFVELRVTKISGRVLGMTACGPAAAELVNELGLVITSGVTVRDMARSIHA
jgi:dihydrolipoamide dehydrogenase